MEEKCLRDKCGGDARKDKKTKQKQKQVRNIFKLKWETNQIKLKA